MSTLALAEVQDFWALGLSLEAVYLPDDEWLEALVSSRVQLALSNSAMGSAETGWKCTQALDAPRTLCAVVPPGQRAEDWPWEQLRDDRDDVAVCWVPFWRTQAAIACTHVSAALRPAFFAECRRWMAELGASPYAPGEDVLAAWDQVMEAAAGPKRDRWNHGDLARQGVVRMALLRFVVRLVRNAR